LVDLAQRLGHERLALVEREEASELFTTASGRRGNSMRALRPLEAFERGHRLLGARGGLDGLASVGPRSLGNLRDDLAGGRAGRVEVLPALRVDPLTVDEHLFHRAGDVDRHLLSPSRCGVRDRPRSKARAYMRS